MIPPLAIEPMYKEKVWGGQALRTRLHKSIDPNARIGESWELSGYGSDQSRVHGGPFDGLTVAQIAESHQQALLGTRVDGSTLPLLCKFIDANDRLSVQVHPTDQQARDHGWDRRGKTECWYVVHAKPGARIIVGFKPGVSPSDVERATRSSNLDTLLNEVDIVDGDVLFIPAGTVHAILEGTLLYEVQETSDCTLRLYDWGRVGLDGKPRDLHVAESMLVIETDYHNAHKIPALALDSGSPLAARALRAACRYFALEEYTLQGRGSVLVPQRASFQVVTVLDGPITLVTPAGRCEAEAGRTVLVPAESTRIEISTQSSGRALVAWVPDLAADIIAPARANGCPDSSIAALGGQAKHNDLLPLIKR